MAPRFSFGPDALPRHAVRALHKEFPESIKTESPLKIGRQADALNVTEDGVPISVIILLAAKDWSPVILK